MNTFCDKQPYICCINGRTLHFSHTFSSQCNMPKRSVDDALAAADHHEVKGSCTCLEKPCSSYLASETEKCTNSSGQDSNARLDSRTAESSDGTWITATVLANDSGSTGGDEFSSSFFLLQSQRNVHINQKWTSLRRYTTMVASGLPRKLYT